MANGLTVLSILGLAPRRMGSIEEYLCALGRRQREAGGRCIVAASDAPAPDVADEFRRSSVEWRTLPFEAGLCALAAAVRRTVREVRPDVTHFHFVHTCSPLFLVARLSGSKRVVLSHHYSRAPGRGWPVLRTINGVRRRLALAPCACVITPSTYLRECLVADQRVPARRIQVVYNGVNIARFDPDRKATLDVRAEYGIPAGAPIVSTVAFFIREKGGDDLLRAAPAVLAQVPDAHLLMIGDGPEIPSLKALADELRVAGRVHFTGLASGERLDSLLAETQIATLVCTWGEAFSLVVLEYMACGKPVVATAVGGTPEAVADGETGLLVPPHSPERIAEALVTLLRDPARAKEMGRAGRRRAEGLFNVDRMVTDTMDVYRQVTR